MIVAGVGLRSTCKAADLVALVRRAEADFGRRASHLAAPAPKAAAPCVRAAARLLDVPLISILMADIQAVQSLCPTRSARVQAALGVASVAEACALAAVGPAGRLLGARIAEARATCAIAVREAA